MREGFWHDAALRFSLQTIVTDRSSSTQTVLSVARLDEIVSRRVMAPHSRIAVGLQLLSY